MNSTKGDLQVLVIIGILFLLIPLSMGISKLIGEGNVNKTSTKKDVIILGDKDVKNVSYKGHDFVYILVYGDLIHDPECRKCKGILNTEDGK